MRDRTSSCGVCGCDARSVVSGTGEIVDCPRCGRYRITLDVLAMLRRHPVASDQVANASSWIRQSHADVVDAQDLEWLRHVPAAPVDEQATRLLRHFATQHPVPGREFEFSLLDVSLYGVAWVHDREHLKFLVQDHMVEEKRLLAIERPMRRGHRVRARITPMGWAHLEQFRDPRQPSRYAFVAMRFHPATLPLRRFAIVPAIERAGYQALIIDEESFDNDVIDQVLSDIRRSRFVIADFTGQRSGVYFEAGFAQGLGVPVIRTCARDESHKLHFDVNHYPFIFWTPESLGEFAEHLQRRIEGLIGRGPRWMKAA